MDYRELFIVEPGKGLRLSVRCKFGRQTLARTQGNGQHAPFA
jgi:hypothetical protein